MSNIIPQPTGLLTVDIRGFPTHYRGRPIARLIYDQPNNIYILTTGNPNSNWDIQQNVLHPQEVERLALAGFTSLPHKTIDLPQTITYGEVIGLRCWIPRKSQLLNRLVLHSVYKTDGWPWDRPMMAPMRPSANTLHQISGIHAFKEDRYDRLKQYVEHAVSQSGEAVVAGRVLLWGEAVEFEHGWRAEYARICHIDCVWCWQPMRPDYRKKPTVLPQEEMIQIISELSHYTDWFITPQKPNQMIAPTPRTSGVPRIKRK